MHTSPEKRFHLAKNNRLCYNCLRRGHSSGKCKIESTCVAEGCKIKHTKFLHTAHSQRAMAQCQQPVHRQIHLAAQRQRMSVQLCHNQGSQSGSPSCQDQSYSREWAFSRYLYMPY